MNRLENISEVWFVFVVVEGVPDSYRSMRVRGMGSWNDGGLRVVWF